MKQRRAEWLFIASVLLIATVLTVLMGQESAEADEDPSKFEIFIVNTGGSDGNSGLEFDEGIRTLERAHEILHDQQPDIAVKIVIQGGVYYCRGMRGQPWTFFNGQDITITSMGDVPSPASASLDDPDRPVFVGENPDGTKCKDASEYFLAINHPKVSTNILISNLRFEQYKGALQIEGVNGYTSVQQNNTIANNVFFRIGDFYQVDATDGKGAIVLDHTNGTTITGNYFWHIRNQEKPALIHAIYMSKRASWSDIEGNTFGGVTGVIVKISHFSNFNEFSNNSFQYAPYAIQDRFCGSGESGDICKAQMAECPSWGNIVSADNTFGSLQEDYGVGIYGYLYDEDMTDCSLQPPTNNVRMVCPTTPITYLYGPDTTGNCGSF